MFKKLPLRFNFTTVVLLLLVGAFMMRMAVFWAKPDWLTSNDADGFKDVAQKLVEEKGFYYYGAVVNMKWLRSYKAPLTPLVAAGILMLSGKRWWVVHLFLCFVGAVTCLNIAFIARILFGEKIGLLSGVLASVYPLYVVLPSVLITENLSLFFSSLAFLLYFKLVEGRINFDQILISKVQKRKPKSVGGFTRQKFDSLKLAGMLGVVLGLETLNRPSTVGFVILLGGYIYFSIPQAESGGVFHGHRKERRGIATVAIIFLTSFLVVLPWTIRNYRIHHRLVPITTNGGITFWDGHNKYVRQGWRPSYFIPDCPDNPLTWRSRSEVEWDKMNYIKGWEFIMQNPLLDLKHDLRKLLMFWSPYNHIIDKLTYIPVLILSLIGIYLTKREARRLLPFYIHTLYLMGLSVIFQGLPRYHIPVMIFFIIMAAVTLEKLFHYALWSAKI